MSDFIVRAVESDDADWIVQFITERWAAEFIAAHYEVFHCRNLPGFVATNDNMNALRFYQKRGFVLVKINRNAIEFAPNLKPVPLFGAEGIPLRDEIELEIILEDAAC